MAYAHSETCHNCGRYLGKNDVYICNDCFKYNILMKKVKQHVGPNYNT